MSHRDSLSEAMTPTPNRRSSGTGRRLLLFNDVELNNPRPDTVACRVTLSGHQNQIFIGEGTSVVLGSAQMNAAARATIHAVRAFANVQLTLESCTKTNAAGRDVALVVVGVDGQEVLAGAVVVRGDDSKAAALAVLHATNRWLEVHGKQTTAA